MKKKVLSIALCRAICPQYAPRCEWLIAAGEDGPEDCPVQMQEVISAIEGGKLRFSRRLLISVRRYVRKREQCFKKHPEYLDCLKLIGKNENPPE